MQLSPARFNRLLKPPGGLGQRVTWRPAYACPCRDPHSGAARQGCLQCAGRGVIWAAPKKAWTGLSGMKVAREWAQFGLWESGDVVLSIPSDSPLYAAGEHDRITMDDSSEPFSNLFTDKVARPEPTGDQLAPTVDDDDMLADGWTPVTVKIGFAPISISRIIWKDPGTEALVEGAIPAVTGSDSLTWLHPDGCPPVGVQVSMTGRRKLEYFLFKELPQDRAHHGGAALPRRVAARRFDLFGR